MSDKGEWMEDDEINGEESNEPNNQGEKSKTQKENGDM